MGAAEIGGLCRLGYASEIEDRLSLSDAKKNEIRKNLFVSRVGFEPPSVVSEG